MKVRGVAIVPGETRNNVYTESTLQDAAESLEGKPVTVDFNNTADNTVGEVIDVEYIEGEGVVYTAEIDGDALDQESDIAPRIFIDDRDGDRAEDIEFDSISIVPDSTDLVGDYEVIE